MSVSSPARALSVVMIALLFVGVALLVPAPHVAAGTAVVFAEDFESGQIPSSWEVRDVNPLSGLDYWGISQFRANTGNYSAWSAEIGTQSIGGQNNSAVNEYDDNMQADLIVNLSAGGFVSLTLSFYYYSHTESGGGDWIQAWYEAGGTLFPIFNNTGGTGNNFDLASVAVPTTVERLIIRFHSDGANHGFEGAYVDDIVLTGSESTPPASVVSSLPTYTNAVPAMIAYTAQDNANASGVAYAELWYRPGTSGNFTLYTTPADPLGQWIARSIPFDASLAAGDGYYEFYTIAVDRAGNAEAPPSGPDASVTIDTTVPALTVTSPPDGAQIEGSALSVTWQASDGLSGIDHYEVSVDGGAFQGIGTTDSTSVGDLAVGSHTVTVRAVDRAGNVRDAAISVVMLGGAPFPWLLILLIVALIAALLVFFVLWKRRKDREEDEAAISAAAGPESAEGATDEPKKEPPALDEHSDKSEENRPDRPSSGP